MWYYASGSERVGPLEESAFRDAVARGLVLDDTLVWREGMGDWQAWANVRGQLPGGSAPAAAPAPAGIAVCVECGNTFPASDMVTYQGNHICAACKPLFFQRIQEGGVLPGSYVFAGFWVRFFAKLIDSIITGIAGYVVQMLLMLGLNTASPETEPIFLLLSIVASMGISIGYVVYFLSAYGATPGKMALGLKVIRPDGGPISVGRAFGRFFAEMLSGLILYIGYFMAAFDDEKRALHDRLCDTRVVKA